MARFCPHRMGIFKLQLKLIQLIQLIKLQLICLCSN
jgi:hypothetical protein